MKLARIAGTLLLVSGLLVLAWALVVWRWQDPFTWALNQREQRRLDALFDRRVERFAPARPVAAAAAPRRALAAEARAYRRATRRGEPIARIVVPRLGLDGVLVEGTDRESLKRGPGRYLWSGMPGEGRLVYVAGHRTTYGAPFARIDALRRGDRITLALPYATFVYAVTGYRIVAATDLSVLRSRGREEVVLQACHPRFFATQRYLVYARPVKVLARRLGAQRQEANALAAREPS